jgi:PAS domain S-box-containing protein
MASLLRLIDMNRLIEVVADAVAAINSEQRIIFFNYGAERLFGYTRTEVIDQPLSILMPERFRTAHAQHVHTFHHSQDISRLMGERQTVFAQRKDGTEFRAEASITKLSQNDEEIMVVLLRDITEREQMQANLRQQAETIAVSNERSRLARDLHDAVSQTLFSASLIADVLPRLWLRNPVEAQRRLEELRTLNRGALAEMRMLLLELRPSALTEARFTDLLTQLGEAVAGRTGIHVDTQVDPAVHDLRLPPEPQVALYRIAQEALNNVIKHSGARNIWIHFEHEPSHLCMRIRDDGRGFNTQQTNRDHLGLLIMHERAQSVAAEFTMESEPGKGTAIAVRIPKTSTPIP